MATKPEPFHFEGRKLSFVQAKSGYSLKLELAPDDIPPQLATDPIGQRYMVVLSPMSDHEPDEEEMAGQRVVMLAGALCRVFEFREFLRLKTHPKFAPEDLTEEIAADWLRKLTGVESRAEYKSNMSARHRLLSINEKYKEWLNARPDTL